MRPRIGMRLVKWTVVGALAASLVLVLVFLLLGLRADRGVNRGTVHIARPPAAVFPWIAEAQRLPRWIGGLVESATVSGDGRSAGTRFRQVMIDPSDQETRFELRGELTEVREGEHLGLHITAPWPGTELPAFEVEVTYRLAPEAGGTRLEYEQRTRYHHWMGDLFEYVVTSSAQKKLDEDLARLARLVEEDPSKPEARRERSDRSRVGPALPGQGPADPPGVPEVEAPGTPHPRDPGEAGAVNDRGAAGQP